MRWPRTTILSVVVVGALAAPVGAATLASFQDVEPDARHAEAIEWLTSHGITQGCAPDLYCGDDVVTRAQLATFLHRLSEAGVVDADTLDGFTAADLEGAQGATGSRGPVGDAGPQGPAGPQGEPGTDGAAGIDGSDGAAGQDGNTVLAGDGEPDGTLGAVGDLYLDTTAIALYGPKDGAGWGGPTSLIGTAGADGADGAAGADGTDGADGRTWLNGVGAPDAGLGADGDLYLDTAADAYYGPKTAENWGTATNLVGPEGPQGLQGEQGIQGVQGETGATGAQGPQGIQGPDGPAGSVSSVVVTGPVATIAAGGAPATSTASCAVGDALMSGGYELTATSLGEEYQISVNKDRPNDTGTGWTVEATDRWSTGGTVRAYAVCSNNPA